MERGEVRHRFTFHAETPRTNALDGGAARHRVPAARLWACRIFHGAVGVASGPGRLALRAGGFARTRQVHREKIYYGIIEARDMSQLLDMLTSQDQLATPVAVIGDSYGAALALRWKTTDPRVGKVVAMAPYGVLSNAVLNICHDYARFLPRAVIRAGLKQLPAVLGVPCDDLDTTTVLARHPVSALFVAGTEDNIVPPADVQRLFRGSAARQQTDRGARGHARNPSLLFHRTCSTGACVAEYKRAGEPMASSHRRNAIYAATMIEPGQKVDQSIAFDTAERFMEADIGCGW